VNFSCPLPLQETEVITLAHGGGGKYTSRLIQEVFLPAFNNEALNLLHDGAFLHLPQNQIVFTTDSFVVQPLFFPGGDIGKLAVTGTVNDLAMCGAKPLYLSCGFIIEEGFLQSDLKRIVESMKKEAEANGVQIVAGDTKVIERQTGSNLFINTSGIGVQMANINPRQIAVGDTILLSGDIGRHGMAVMAMREGFQFSTPLISDCASLVPLVKALLEANIPVHALRDLTRGGLATALVEMAEVAEKDFLIEEEAIPVSDPVNSACEILGIDPLYVANEGRLIAFVPKERALEAEKIMQRFEKEATKIGEVAEASANPAPLLQNAFGAERCLYRLIGDQLPRIC
jgi:hydrogenase expression/formation protein HypE